MSTIRNERIIPIDVDDTLVMHTEECLEKVSIPDVLHPGEFITLGVNQNMLRLMREEKQRGSFIIVWSRGGFQWAEDVLTALGIRDQADLVLSKPLVYFDDKEVSEWLCDRVHIPPGSKYKRRPTKPKNNLEAFLRKVSKEQSGCWIWKGTKNEGGYGYFKYLGKMRSAHRVSYTFYKGEIPNGLQIDHLCRVKDCVNPDHLEAVTAKENTLRNPNHHSKRGFYRKECSKGHSLEDLINVEYYTTRGRTVRRCKECRKGYRKTGYNRSKLK